MGFKKAFDKLKEQKNKAVQKLPKPLRQKADDKLGLFIHKYIATIFYFDDEIQEIYWDMEEAVQEGRYEDASDLSMEMRTLITLKTNPESGYYSRKHEKMINKASKKIRDATETLKGKNSLGTIKEFLKLNKEEDMEDMDLSNDIEDMIDEVDN